VILVSAPKMSRIASTSSSTRCFITSLRQTDYQKREVGTLTAQSAEAGFGGGRGAVDQIIDVGLHELRRTALRDVAEDENNALSLNF
jgi:hypothetical protein